MKANCVTSRNRWFLGRLVSASVLLLLGVTAMGQAVLKSPVGTWDCVMSGAREGLARMSFLANGTFVNDEILVPKATQFTLQHNDVRNSGDDGRFPTGILLTNTPLPVHTNIFGWQSLAGQWGFDSRGRVIGYFFETTYSVTVTNAITNQLSFVGTVVPGKRLALLLTSPAGKVNFNGVPDAPLADLSGNWYGVERDSSLWFTEFFTLTAVPGLPNLYAVDGSGPAYNFTGMAMVTPQKKFAIATESLGVGLGEDSRLVRSAVGPFNPKRFSGALHGLRDPMAGSISRITYSVQHQ